MVEGKFIIANDEGGYDLMLRWSTGVAEKDFSGSLPDILAYIQLREMGIDVL